MDQNPRRTLLRRARFIAAGILITAVAGTAGLTAAASVSQNATGEDDSGWLGYGSDDESDHESDDQWDHESDDEHEHEHEDEDDDDQPAGTRSSRTGVTGVVPAPSGQTHGGSNAS